MPDIRPFRALRYDPATIADLALVVAPPYDVIDAAEEARLLERHPANVVRLDKPSEQPGDEADDRYRRAARTLAGWRSDGTFRKDPHPSLYVYEQAYRVPGDRCDPDPARVLRTPSTACVRIEGAVLPHERTMSGPKEDRYKLLRATGVNTSPVVAVYDDPSGASPRVIEAVTARAADVDLTDDDGVRHRLWAIEADGDGAAAVAPLLDAAARGPVTIADGHHRYETALRYRDERRMSRSCEEDPAFDYILTLFIDAGGRAADRPADPPDRARPGRRRRRRRCSDRLEELFEVERDVTRRPCGNGSRRPGWPAAARAGSGCGRAPAGRS